MGYTPFDHKNYGPLGPNSEATIELTRRYSAANYDPLPFVATRGTGAILYDSDGNEIVDCMAGYSAVLEHSCSEIIEAVCTQMRTLGLTSRALYTERYSEFVAAVAMATGYDRVLPKSDGGMITETAIHGLFMHADARGIEKPEIILVNKFFHGRALPFVMSDRVSGIRVAPEYSVEAVTNMVNRHTVGILLETHLGEGGPLFTDRATFLGIRELCHERGLFLIADEIQTGLGRCGYMLGWQEFGEEARPDAVTIGKALGGGVYPVSALCGTDEFMGIFAPGTEGGTWGGNPIACAAALASLAYIRDHDICTRAIEIGNRMVSQLQGIPGVDVDHRGALIGIRVWDIPSTKPLCLEMALGRALRVFTVPGHAYVDPVSGRQNAYVRLAPPIGAMTNDLIDRIIKETIRPVLEETSAFVAAQKLLVTP